MRHEKIDTLVSANRQFDWGSLETLSFGRRYRVKRMKVNPGASLSMETHLHRDEHWIVVEGSARVFIGTSSRLITENQAVVVPLGTPHRVENPGVMPLHLIEVQTGGYLEDDDISPAATPNLMIAEVA